jgi:zinc protease
MLAGCPSARLHRRMVIEREAASSVDAQLTPFRDPSLLRLAVTAARGHRADELLAIIDHEIAALAEQAPPAAEVEKAKALAETDFWSSLVDVDGKAEALGHYETGLGDFRRVNVIAERLAAVTAEDVVRVVRAYLRPERRTIVIAEPEPDDGSDEDDAEGDDDDDDNDDAEPTDGLAA